MMNTTVLPVGVPTSQRAMRATHREAGVSLERRHDLDALRAIAMLLGIVLHAALSLAPMPWTVQDSQQSDVYAVMVAGLHGFRMPLFFLLSGFFTAMLWRRRGLGGLVRQRVKRIFLPLMIGCVTIVPAMWGVSYVASLPAPGTSQGSPLFTAVVAGDREEVDAALQDADASIDLLDPASGSSPLCTAIFLGHTEIAAGLIAAGANINLPNRDLATPLHIAVFMGRAREAELLLEAGADVKARDGNGVTPQGLLALDYGTTNWIASSLGVPLREDALLDGRREIARLLHATDANGGLPLAKPENRFAGLEALLFQLPVFMHLWFLWFLCWFVAAFLIYAPLVNAWRFRPLPAWVWRSPICLLWLIPLTMVPQVFMVAGTFGPDASIGLVPIPSVLLYYAIFFFTGAVYWDRGDVADQLGKRWYLSLPVALLVVFPLGMDTVAGTFGIMPSFTESSITLVLGSLFQAAYAWLMTLGLIGLFRHLLSRESRIIRYLSDASYWLYLVHLPLVILAQWAIQNLPIPPALKLTGIVLTVSAFGLLTYASFVRYSWIGRLLNGPRSRVGDPFLTGTGDAKDCGPSVQSVG